MFINKTNKNIKVRISGHGTSKLVYQYKEGRYLPDTCQPSTNNATEYTPHKSTRYINISMKNDCFDMKDHKRSSTKMINKGETLPELYKIREHCCGCTACYCICPKNAIKLEPDEEGFDYPVVDASLCIRCNKCVSVCPIKKRIHTN